MVDALESLFCKLSKVLFNAKEQKKTYIIEKMNQMYSKNIILEII